jgi:FkbM family methyltransferase
MIADLGANVGYSVAHWLSSFPDASIIAFEPHPINVGMLYRHLEENHGLWRCRVVAAGAGAVDKDMYLSDRGNVSDLVTSPEDGRRRVPVRDFFREVRGLPIDLIKMDIEGGEFEILSDERMRTIDTRAIVVEWHNTVDMRDGEGWCRERLSNLGFEVFSGTINYQNAGLLWGWKSISEWGHSCISR